jgi:SulP family sulfate permease
MAAPGLGKTGRSGSDGGVHFTWLLSTEREDDLDMVSDDDGDDAMVQLDEEYIDEIERQAAVRDQERDEEEDSDIDQLELEDRIARAEYDDGPTLVSPRGRRSSLLAFSESEIAPQENAGCFHRTMHHIPCTTCCFPMDGSRKKDCNPTRAAKKTKRYCAPNLELLRTLRIVKHIRIFRKILAGTSKASYYSQSNDNGSSNTSNTDDTSLGLSEIDSTGDMSLLSTSSLGSSMNSGDHSSNASNTLEMEEYDVNEVTGERTRRRRIRNDSMRDDSVQLDLESGLSSNNGRSNPDVGRFDAEINSMGKPSWPQRKQAAVRRVKDLAKETLSNVKPGVLTAVVNFPLVLAVAGGVGAHPYFGLNAAFWAAMAATFFGGSRYTIAAPTMLLTSNLVGTVATYGTFVLPVIALLSAVMIYLLLFTRAIEFVTFVPSMVTHGVTLGTSALVIIYQLKFALGLAGNIHASSVPYYILEMCSTAISSTNWRAVLMFGVALALSYTIIRWGRGFNIAFVLVPLGIIIGWLLDFTLRNQTMEKPYIETLGSRYGHIEFHPFLMTHWQTALFNWEVIGKAMEVAFICVMESYSTAQMTYEITGKRFSKNHEMFSLATANFVSGVFGGMPTSVGVTRTLLNIRSGATSRAAGLVNGILLLLFSLTMTSWLRWFPLPVVACLQIVSAWRSVDVAVWAKAWGEDRQSTLTSFITAMLCVAINPFIGLLIGIIVSMSIFSRQLSKGHSELTVKTKVHRIQVERDTLLHSPRSSTIINVTNPRINPIIRSSSNTISTLSTNGPAPKLARLRQNRTPLASSLTDLPASRTLSIRNAVAQLQPILDSSGSDGERSEALKYNVVVYRISGVMTFINAQTHFETLKSITNNKHVTCLILNVRFLYYIDYDGKIVLRNLIQYIDSKLFLPTYLVGVTTDLAKHIKKDTWYKQKKKEDLIWKLESDAFKDIQRRNAEMIESGQGLASADTASEATSNADRSDVSETGSFTAMPSSTSPATTSGSPLSRPLGNMSPSGSNTDLRVSGSANRAKPRQIFQRSRTSGSSSALVSVSAPADSESSSAPMLTRTSSKKSFVARRTVIGASSPSSPNPRLDYPDDLITTEEMELAIGEAALAHGLDPAKAVASAEAILRANRVHRDLQHADEQETHSRHDSTLLDIIHGNRVAQSSNSPSAGVEPGSYSSSSSSRKKNESRRNALLQSGVISAPIRTTEGRKKGDRKKVLVSPAATSISPGNTSDVPHGLSRFQYGSFSPHSDDQAGTTVGTSSGAEFDAEDEQSDGSDSSLDSGSSSSSGEEDNLGTIGFMSPHDDEEGPLHQSSTSAAAAAAPRSLVHPLNLTPILKSASLPSREVGARSKVKRSASPGRASSSAAPKSEPKSNSQSLSDLPTLFNTSTEDIVMSPPSDSEKEQKFRETSSILPAHHSPYDGTSSS